MSPEAARRGGLKSALTLAGQDTEILKTGRVRSCSWRVRAGSHVSPGRGPPVPACLRDLVAGHSG